MIRLMQNTFCISSVQRSGFSVQEFKAFIINILYKFTERRTLNTENYFLRNSLILQNASEMMRFGD